MDVGSSDGGGLVVASDPNGNVLMISTERELSEERLTWQMVLVLEFKPKANLP